MVKYTPLWCNLVAEVQYWVPIISHFRNVQLSVINSNLRIKNLQIFCKRKVKLDFCKLAAFDENPPLLKGKIQQHTMQKLKTQTPNKLHKLPQRIINCKLYSVIRTDTTPNPSQIAGPRFAILHAPCQYSTMQYLEYLCAFASHESV